MTPRAFAMRQLGSLLVLAMVTMAGVPASVGAQPARGTLKIALVPQWVVNQHRAGASLASRGGVSPQLSRALDGGVVERVVFWWQRGVIQREALVWKPFRVLDGAEAAALGGRGGFDLVAVRPPTGGAAWTEVEIAPRASQPAEVAVLEIGGELAPLRQVLDSLFLASADGSVTELDLARRALVRGEGVHIITAPFDRPVTVAEAPGLFRGGRGLEFLVVRSQVEVTPGGEATPNGFGDLSAFSAGAWREGDRVFARVPVAAMRAGLPSVVMGWRDRLVRPDGGDVNELRRSSRLVPLSR